MWPEASRVQLTVGPLLRALLLLPLISYSTCGAQAAPKPNIVLIFCDDLGYGDLACYGSTKHRTPAIDSLARDGITFTGFYSSSPVCTPSRSSLLTGCYARRVGLHEDKTGHWVLIPRSVRGMHPNETTLPELLKSVGYATACIGKWHLGDQPEHLPTAHGFDQYFGIPYSNDMAQKGRGDPPLPMVRDTTVVQAPVDQASITGQYTEQSIAFIEASKKAGKPFFLFLPHTFPHLPLFASPAFHGKSANGRYGDSVEEIDDSTGTILATLDRLGLKENTLVIFTSDNGSNGRNGGSNAPLAGAKGSTMEGGMRVPFIARWPAAIPAGSRCSELGTMMDLLPTLAGFAGAELPAREIDGHDIAALLRAEPGARSPTEVFYYYRRRQLQAVRIGPWKYHLPLRKIYPQWSSVEHSKEVNKAGKLVHLPTDIRETTHLENVRVMAAMNAAIAEARSVYGDEAASGSGQRAAADSARSEPLVFPQGLKSKQQK